MTTQKELFKQYSEPWKPHAYQKKAVKFLLEHACGALFLDPGLGKTSITLAAIKFLKARGLINKVLLIAPLRACYSVWPREAERWSDFNTLRVEVLHGSNKNAALRRDADIYVINPEGLDWLLSSEKAKGFTRMNFDTLVIDELSKFKHPNTARFKTMKRILNKFSRRWGLTGSPAPNGLMDLFGQCYMLDEGNALGRYITHYRSAFFQTNPHNKFEWCIQSGAEQRIYERLAPLVLRMAAEDYLELPELVDNIIRVDLPAPARAVYDELERELFALLDGETITAANAAVASMKCRQLASGGVYLDPADQLDPVFKAKRDWTNLHTAKVDALADLVDELQGEPLLVAYDFQHDLDRLRARFGADVPVIGGGTTAARSDELVRLWNAGKLPLLFGHPAAMAHGLNLQGAGRHVCWHSLTWDFELYDQFIRRVHRQGNTAQRVIVHHIVARGTVDEAVLAALRAKGRGQRALFNALKALQGQK